MERSVSAYEAGVSALNEARKIEEEQKARLFQIENQIEKNRDLQKDLAEERLLLARERVGSGKTSGAKKAPMTNSATATAGAAVVPGPVASTGNLSAGEIIDHVGEQPEMEDKTISDALDSFLVDATPSASREQLSRGNLGETLAYPLLQSRLAYDGLPSSVANTPQRGASQTQRAPASNDRFSTILGAALGRGSVGNGSGAPSFGADEVLLSSFGQLGDASTTEAVMLLIEGQRENEYLKEEQKFLAKLRLTNKKR